MIINFYLILACLIFTIGLCGLVFNKRNLLVSLMSIEIMLISINLNLVAASSRYNSIDGQIFTMFTILVAAAEAAIGLAILIIYFRTTGSLSLNKKPENKE
jgi:NADH-quinone oxidoreductase subunit K